MLVKQISIFTQNIHGDLAGITAVLADNNIDLKSLSIADTSSFGVIRAIVEDAEKAVHVLKAAGFTAKITEVLAFEVADRPGGLAEVLKVFEKEDIEIEYLYSFVRSKTGSALIVFRTEDLDHTIQLLNQHGVKLLSNEEVHHI